jgi:hypothetical protein
VEFDAETMRAKKIVAIAIASEELIRHSSVEAESVIRGDLLRASVSILEQKFLSDDAVSDDAPAGILQSVTPVVATGDVDVDMAAIVASFQGDLSRAWWVAQPQVYAQLFPFSRGMCGLRGGELMTSPAVATRHAPADTLVLVDPDRIAIGMAGVRVDASQQATIAMHTDPAGDMQADDSPPTVTGLGGSAEKVDLVSLWQQNAMALLAEIHVNWRALPGSVTAMDVTAWASSESPE